MTETPRSDRPGTVVVSVDAELGWGHHDLADPPVERVEYARTGWVRLLDALDEYDLPATWAVVGHLFLDDCDGRHADHPTPEGWFARESGEWADRPELRFGRGLVDRIEDASADHELGSHTFSHVPFGVAETTSEVARAELAASERAAGRGFDSFVFPRNYVGHRDALADAGYTCYRGSGPGAQVGGVASLVRKVARSAGYAGAPLVDPAFDEHGLVNVPASLYLFDFEGVARAAVEAVADDPVVRAARRGVDAAANTGRTVHLWLHPNNVRSDRHARRIRRVFEYVAERRNDGAVRVETMGEVAERVRGERTGVSDTPRGRSVAYSR
ncbi:polysaccharide deacetylase family protein [Halobacterium litoreum]|uniref:Polysaccharide deacetylase family protein n=1 Tax=Halobacterium litoreum TaxID=2039234 RepID=A0ABD5NBV0_9EURY|nr:polysaccharide deacetylase family protein [Halobacterium litoreum]UHH14652.1 polysaccharide deacetylase family protein [Halobacterium litoreum]